MEAIIQLFVDTKDNKSVETILIRAKIDKNNFFLLNLSAKRPNKGAKRINSKLAIEFDIPRQRVLSDESIVTAKYSAKIIGKKPASTIVA